MNKFVRVQSEILVLLKQSSRVFQLQSVLNLELKYMDLTYTPISPFYLFIYFPRGVSTLLYTTQLHLQSPQTF